ncbi:MAG: M48 family metalloprotease [Bdellovibrionota bacterium]
MRNRNIQHSVIALAALSLVSCADGQFNSLGSGLLSSTGLVNGSQADSLMKFGSGVAKGVQSLSPEEEYYLGRGVAATVLGRYRPYNNAAVNAYVNKVAVTVAAFSDRPDTFGGYHVQILDTPEINAVSAPGGFIFISTGFLKLIPNEDALAAVLAHEVGHIVKGHGVKAISQANLTQAFLLLGKEAAASQGGNVVQELTATFGDSITDITNTLLSKGYGRSQEYEADAYGAEVLQRAGYNPQGLKVMLSRLEEAAHAAPSGGWMSTHPAPEDRINEVAKSLPAARPESAGEAARNARFAKAMKGIG